jgi:hypothetical protein
VPFDMTPATERPDIKLAILTASAPGMYVVDISRTIFPARKTRPLAKASHAPFLSADRIVFLI